MSDFSKALRSKLCIEDACQFDEGCGCLEAIDDALVPLRAENERLRKEIDGIIGMCLGNAGIGQIHAKAMRALEGK